MSALAAHLESLLTEKRVRRMRGVLARRSDHLAFAFERMVDPHNLSAVLRSMDALGFQDAHLVAPDPRVAVSRGVTTGVERWLTLHHHETTAACVAALRDAGYRVLASLVTEGSGEALEALDFSRRTALVFGNEHAGVGAEVVALADGTFHIPMHGFGDSFNLSVAAALCGHHARREMERQGAGRPEVYLLGEARREAIYLEWLKRSVKNVERIIAEFEAKQG